MLLLGLGQRLGPVVATGQDEEADSDMLAAAFSLVARTAATRLQASLQWGP